MEPRVYPYHTRTEEESLLSDYRPRPEKTPDRYWLHLTLFLLTLLTATFVGGEYAGRLLAYEETDLWFMLGGLPITAGFVLDGLAYAISLLLFLTVHEFGHYFAARLHGVDTSLPYYIPSPLTPGTFGAVIRIREPVPDLRRLFDIGAAGPIAGFVVALGVLLYALSTLPGPEYILGIPGHEELKAYIGQTGRFPAEMPTARPDEGVGLVIILGQTPLFWILSQLFPDVPPLYELYHYPVLFAGWLGLFFTALNLLPVGQLDGGHVLYAMLGRKWHTRLARGFVVLLLVSGSIGFVNTDFPWLAEQGRLAEALSWFILAGILYFFLNRVFQSDHRQIAPVLLGILAVAALAKVIGDPLTKVGYVGWLVFSLLIVWLIRVDHPPVFDARPITPGRRLLGYLCLLIFILCFSIRPFYIV